MSDQKGTVFGLSKASKVKVALRKKRPFLTLLLVAVALFTISTPTGFHPLLAAPAVSTLDSAVNVAISSVSVSVGGTGTTDVVVNGYSGLNGLGAYDVRIQFDPAKVVVTGVAGGDGLFSATPTHNTLSAANTSGSFTVTAFHVTTPGPTGPTIRIARVTWQGLSAGIHSLRPVVVILADVNGLTVNGPGGANTFVPGINGSVAVGVAPTAGFTRILSPPSGVAPCNVTFTDNSTGVPHAWYWSFGDATSSTSQNPVKTYTEAGNYTVVLTATNTNGSSSASQNVSIYSTPLANFSAYPGGANPGTLVSFADASSGNVVTWSWDFGDGTGSSTQNPKKSYSVPGNYTVSLTVTNPAGTNTATKTGYLSIVTYQTEITLTQGTDPNAYVGGRIVRFFDMDTRSTVALAEGLSAFRAYASYSPDGVTVKAASGVGPFATPAIALNTASGTRTSISHSQAGASPSPPVELFRLYPWLIGSKDVPYTMSLHFDSIALTGAREVPLPASVARTFRRGDANGDGIVNITDALFIAQYLAGLRGLGESTSLVNPVNAATARNDSGSSGSTISIQDALFIAQMLVGMRDGFYNLVT